MKTKINIIRNLKQNFISVGFEMNEEKTTEEILWVD